MKGTLKRWICLLVCCVLAGAAAAAPIKKAGSRGKQPAKTVPAHEIVLRHDLSGQALDALATLTLRFNDEQKGRARIKLQGLAGLTETGEMPQLALLDVEDAEEFFGKRPKFRPLHLVMAEAGEKLPASRLLPLIADAVDDPSGRVQALPLALSAPVILWNKNAFAKAGLDPDKAPTTWLEVQKLAGALFDAGHPCPLTSSRFAWVHLENLSYQHGEPIAVSQGGKATVVLNRMVDVKHLALLASWQKSSYFHYFGPGREGTRKFLAGECAMLTGPHAVHAMAKSGFAAGVAPLPHHEDVYGVTPGKLLPDGAALWALAGHKKQDYKVAAMFAKFLLRPEVQKEWIKATGFLPMTQAAVDTFSAHPSAAAVLPRARLAVRSPGGMRGKHGFGLDRLRAILHEEVSGVWSGAKPAKEALDTAMARINTVGAISRR